MTDLYKQRFSEIHDQMEALLASQKNAYSESRGNHRTINSEDLLEWTVKTKNLLNKACGQNSDHYQEFLKNENIGSVDTPIKKFGRLRSVFRAAREDYEGGYLRSTRSLIQAEVFDTELEQAQAFLNAGYKTPAAVVAGVVLETSLRELCAQQGIPHESEKLEKMNADLAKKGVYNKLQQKRITALADIRNSAAHGHPDQFKEADVRDMIRDITRFVSEYL